LWTELDHPEVGRLKYPLGVFDSDEVSPASVAAPSLGQDNRAIYCGELGYELADLAVLRASRVI
jgi:hypothetical protein